MRYYFHLVGPGDESILDEDGIESASLEAAQAEAILAVQEILTEHEDAGDSWNSWQLKVADGLQRVLFTINLDRQPHLEYVTKQRSVVESERYVFHSLLAALAFGIVWDSLIPMM
ncbi:DUF6894 family protein [Microvirga zambiensis]|uniref:DUF6894 family protein n=1 Tax=Microvirga zambiensis TaxID=1402137 RepID=UPI00191DA760|nr:hypothetical protein [Microvirga zambiensis]